MLVKVHKSSLIQGNECIQSQRLIVPMISPLKFVSSQGDLRAGAEGVIDLLISSTHLLARQQLDRCAGTWSTETSRDFQEVQHQGSVCVIDLAKIPASMIPPARGSLTSAHMCMCVDQS